MYHPSLSIIIHYHPLSAIIVYHPFSSTNNYYTHDCSPIITTSLVNVYIANWKFPPSLTSVNQLNLPFSLFWHNQRENLQPKKHCCWVYHQLFPFFFMFFFDFDAFSHGFPMVFPWFRHGFPPRCWSWVPVLPPCHPSWQPGTAGRRTSSPRTGWRTEDFVRSGAMGVYPLVN